MTNMERVVEIQKTVEEENGGWVTNGFNRKVWNPDGSVFAEVLYWCETNPCANPATANNGGGYSNPEICVKVGNDLWVILDDNCGDFGNRIYVSCLKPDAEAYELGYGCDGARHAQYGSMFDAEDEYSEFTWRDNNAIDTICMLLDWRYSLDGAYTY